MNTTDLIKQLSKNLGISQSEARQLLHAELNTISKILAQGDTVIIRGFGTFGTRTSRKADTSKTAFFRPSSRLKDFIKSWRPE